mgnify:CR=1 FL=1
MATRDAYLMQMLVGVPVSLLFMGLVIGAQVLMQWWNWQIIKDQTDELETGEQKVAGYMKYVPSVINAALIVLFGVIYKWLALRLVKGENHRYTQEFENSLINKTYMFQFVNTYISNFVAAFYTQNFGSLTTNLVIVMVFKQLFMTPN